VQFGSQGGATPLAWALAMGHAALAQLLRAAGADEARAASCGLESAAT
jgi:ankyrin repeat protein